MVPLVRITKDHKKEAGVRVAVGDHRTSNVGGHLGQGLSQRAAGREGEMFWETSGNVRSWRGQEPNGPVPEAIQPMARLGAVSLFT